MKPVEPEWQTRGSTAPAQKYRAPAAGGGGRPRCGRDPRHRVGSGTLRARRRDEFHDRRLGNHHVRWDRLHVDLHPGGNLIVNDGHRQLPVDHDLDGRSAERGPDVHREAEWPE